MEHLTYDDGIQVTGTNISSTPKSSNLELLTDNLPISSTSTDISTLYRELSDDNKLALQLKPYLLTIRLSSIALLCLVQKMLQSPWPIFLKFFLPTQINTKYLNYDVMYKQTNDAYYITIGSQGYFQ